MAERVGFEPTVGGLPLHTLSKRAPSTTRTSLRVEWWYVKVYHPVNLPLVARRRGALD